MSFRPGTNITIQDTPPPRSAPTDTGVWFVAGVTEKGPIEPTLIGGMAEFERVFGVRVAYSTLYDPLDLFFHEGGARVYVSRVVGPAAAAAFKVLQDVAPADTLRVEAYAPGEWGNALNVAVLAGDVGGNFKLQISHDVDGILETSTDLADKAAAFAWAVNSQYIVLIDQVGTGDPVTIAAQALAGGDDDRDGIVDAHWLAALDRFDSDYGAGQVSVPGRTSDTGHTQLTAHAIAYNRVALYDLADTDVVATLKAAAVAARGEDGSYGGTFSPWVEIPGVAAGTTRLVSPSGLIAALIARNDGAGYSQNVPSAGTLGQAAYAVGLSQTAWEGVDRQELNEGGVNVIREMFGGVRVYGWRTIVDPILTPRWISLGNSRLRMAIAALGDQILEEYIFDQIDGKGALFSDLKGALTGMLLGFFNEGSLYGNTPDEAFYVDVGTQVNTPQTIQAQELHAVVAYRDSPFAEFVQLVLVKRSVTEAVV